MQLKNKYYYFKKAIKQEVCQKIILAGLNKLEQTKIEKGYTEAFTFDGLQAKNKSKSDVTQDDKTRDQLKKEGIDNNKILVRDSTVSWLKEDWMYELFIPFARAANINAGWKWSMDFSESFQFTIYKGDNKKKQFYSWHTDSHSDHFAVFKPAVKVDDKVWKQGILDDNNDVIYDGQGKPKYTDKDVPLREGTTLFKSGWTSDLNMAGKVRKMSMTCNLTNPENYEGGKLKFDFGQHMEHGDRFHTCEEIMDQGSIIFFPSFTYHCVTPVTRGTRYSLVMWTLGKPWK